MKIDVLGTRYDIYTKNKLQDKWLEKCDGYCDKTSHKIVVRAKDDEFEIENYDIYRKKVLRHELIHAFLFESGLHENFKHEAWGHDETTIDWIAAQFPKLLKAFKEADCL